MYEIKCKQNWKVYKIYKHVTYDSNHILDLNTYKLN